jgi:hypothetical protein
MLKCWPVKDHSSFFCLLSVKFCIGGLQQICFFHEQYICNSECGLQVVYRQTDGLSGTATYPFLTKVDIYNNIWSIHSSVMSSCQLVVLYNKLLSWQTKIKVQLDPLRKDEERKLFKSWYWALFQCTPFPQLVLETWIIFCYGGMQGAIRFDVDFILNKIIQLTQGRLGHSLGT